MLYVPSKSLYSKQNKKKCSKLQISTEFHYFKIYSRAILSKIFLKESVDFFFKILLLENTKTGNAMENPAFYKTTE